MNIKYWIGCSVVAATFTACSDTTNEIGTSIINEFDRLTINTETFDVQTQSIKVDSVLSQSALNYLGMVLDPETNTIVSSSFSTQFHTLENFSIPVSQDSIVGRDNGRLVADSCVLSLLYDSYYGDSLAVMKVTAYEMDKPMLESRKYYSNFNPETSGYLRTNGYEASKVYTLVNPAETPAERASNGSLRSIDIALNAPYTAKNNVIYTNFGSYLLNSYYNNPSNFRNAYAFINNVVPGFYLKTTGGRGSMANIYLSRINVYYTYKANGRNQRGVITFSGTEEVLSATHINNSVAEMQALTNNNTCTYLKTPAGIVTEVTLPVDQIISAHRNDSINSARIAFTRINPTNTSGSQFAVPQMIMMLPKSEMKSFFESKNMVDNRTSFLSTFDRNLNQYVFTNIAVLVKHLYDLKQAGNAAEDWNKVVLIPVTTSYATDANTNTSLLTGVFNDMSLTDVKLVGGSENPNAAVKISVVYSRFK